MKKKLKKHNIYYMQMFKRYPTYKNNTKIKEMHLFIHKCKICISYMSLSILVRDRVFFHFIFVATQIDIQSNYF